jgi:hypothetical protein
MSEPSPESPSEPAPDEPRGFAAWAEKHLNPGLADARIKAANADTKADRVVAFLKAHATLLAEIADILGAVISAADPAVAPLVAGLEERITAAAQAAKDAAAEFDGAQM